MIKQIKPIRKISHRWDAKICLARLASMCFWLSVIGEKLINPIHLRLIVCQKKKTDIVKLTLHQHLLSAEENGVHSQGRTKKLACTTKKKSMHAAWKYIYVDKFYGTWISTSIYLNFKQFFYLEILNTKFYTTKYPISWYFSKDAKITNICNNLKLMILLVRI